MIRRDDRNYRRVEIKSDRLVRHDVVSDGGCCADGSRCYRIEVEHEERTGLQKIYMEREVKRCFSSLGRLRVPSKIRLSSPFKIARAQGEGAAASRLHLVFLPPPSDTSHRVGAVRDWGLMVPVCSSQPKRVESVDLTCRKWIR